MSLPLVGGIPPDLDLTENYVLEFTALDAVTGAAVTSVVVSNASLLVANLREGDLTPAVEFEDPLWISLPADAINGN